MIKWSRKVTLSLWASDRKVAKEPVLPTDDSFWRHNFLFAWTFLRLDIIMFKRLTLKFRIDNNEHQTYKRQMEPLDCACVLKYLSLANALQSSPVQCNTMQMHTLQDLKHYHSKIQNTEIIGRSFKIYLTLPKSQVPYQTPPAKVTPSHFSLAYTCQRRKRVQN